MKYKVGDKVRIKSLDWYNENKNEYGEVICKENVFVKSMTLYCDSILTIENKTENYYWVKENAFHWTDEMIEGLVEEEIIDLTSIVMETVEEKTIQNTLTYGYNLPEGYIFKDQNGNVINATKIVLEKKKPRYPKTYEECCKVLEIEGNSLLINTKHITDYERDLGNLMGQLHRLIICRDAYWKIAGEEMGLGKPWEPDYRGTFKDGTPIKYVIYNIGTHIVKERKSSPNHILSFPTEEMRDAFYENFKELINECKELL